MREEMQEVYWVENSGTITVSSAMETWTHLRYSVSLNTNNKLSEEKVKGEGRSKGILSRGENKQIRCWNASRAELEPSAAQVRTPHWAVTFVWIFMPTQWWGMIYNVRNAKEFILFLLEGKRVIVFRSLKNAIKTLNSTCNSLSK